MQEEKRMTSGNLFIIALCIEKNKTVLFYCYEAIDFNASGKVCVLSFCMHLWRVCDIMDRTFLRLLLSKYI